MARVERGWHVWSGLGTEGGAGLSEEPAPTTVGTDSHSWATATASRVPVPARAADGPLTFGPAQPGTTPALAESDAGGDSTPNPTDEGWGLGMERAWASCPIDSRIVSECTSQPGPGPGTCPVRLTGVLTCLQGSSQALARVGRDQRA